MIKDRSCQFDEKPLAMHGRTIGSPKQPDLPKQNFVTLPWHSVLCNSSQLSCFTLSWHYLTRYAAALNHYRCYLRSHWTTFKQGVEWAGLAAKGLP